MLTLFQGIGEVFVGLGLVMGPAVGGLLYGVCILGNKLGDMGYVHSCRYIVKQLKQTTIHIFVAEEVIAKLSILPEYSIIMRTVLIYVVL